MTKNAPIAIFIYNRPDHLRRTLTSLRACTSFHESSVVVFGDGPKFCKDENSVIATRRVARDILGPEAEYRFSSINKGLAASIIEGVGDLVKSYGRVIVIEDDLELSPDFLTYLNKSLDKYENANNVFQISGHVFDVPEFFGRDSALFLPFTSTWGWATWRRSWEKFDPEARGWHNLENNQTLRHRFNVGGNYDYSTMLQVQMNGNLDSWGIRWYWSVFCAGGIILFPPETLVRNIGMDGSGTHGSGRFRSFSRHQHAFPKQGFNLPEPQLFEKDMDAVKRALWRQNGGWIGFFIDRVRSILRKLIMS